MGLFGSWFDDLLGGGGAMPNAPIATTPTQAPVPAQAPPDAIAQLQAMLQQRANPSPWQKVIGALGGGLKDYGMFASGHPEQTNNVSGYFDKMRAAQTQQLGQNALGQVMGDASTPGQNGQLPPDLPLKLAKLQALGVDITPIQTMLSLRSSMAPKYSKDDMGNIWQETPGQPPKLITLGPGKAMSGKEPTVAVNSYGGGGASTATPQGQPSFQSFYQQFLAPHEGGYTPSDGNGAPANFGINQKSNPDVNVATLTPDKAQQIMRDRYWTPSGADSLPPGLAAIQADTAVNMGVGTAKQLLQASGGDPQKYLALRAQRYQDIVARDPSKASSLPGWLQRVKDLGQYASGLGQSAGPDATAVPQGSAHVLYDPGPEIVPIAQAGAAAQKAYPGAVAMEKSGKPIYPPATLMASQMTPDAQTVDYWAHSVAAGGPMPTLGMGAQAAAIRQSILKRAAEINTGQGLTGADQNARVATTKANTSTLGKITALRAASESYENTMLQNIGLAKQMMSKGAGQYGAPVINRWTQYIRKEYAGDPDVAAFNTAVQTVKNEYAKIQSGSIGNAPVSDASRREAEGMLDPNQTPQQIQANFDYMVKETGNRLRALRGQEGALRSGLSGKGDTPSMPQVSHGSGPVSVKNAADYNRLPSGSTYIDPNGVQRTKR